MPEALTIRGAGLFRRLCVEAGGEPSSMAGLLLHPHSESMEVTMTSHIRVFLGTLAVSVISWVFHVAVVVPLCLPRR